jgi:hypothetical protein
MIILTLFSLANRREKGSTFPQVYAYMHCVHYLV